MDAPAKTEKKKLTNEQYDSLTIVTEKATCSFPNLWKKGYYQGKEKTSYDVTFLFPKTTDMTRLRKVLTQAKVYAFGKDQKEWPQNTTPEYWNRAIKDGDTMLDKNDKLIPGYAGFWVVSATCKDKPEVLDRNGDQITEESEIYGGCIVRGHVQAAVYEISKKNIGEKFYLKSLKKIADGPRLGNGRSSAKAFDEFDDGDEASNVEENYEAPSDDGDDGDFEF